jgi:DNA helicase-4
MADLSKIPAFASCDICGKSIHAVESSSIQGICNTCTNNGICPDCSSKLKTYHMPGKSFIGCTNLNCKYKIYLPDEKNRDLRHKIINFLKNKKFQDAENLYSSHRILSKNEYEKLKNENIRLAKQEIITLLQNSNFKEADSLFVEYRVYSKNEYDKLKTDYVKNHSIKLLTNNQFLEADNLFFEYPIFPIAEYEKNKAVHIKKSIEKLLSVRLNDEQALAIAKTDRNLLLKARAGSGKTTTIACKTAYLIEHEKVNPDEIMILAFNKKAAEEIKNRIRNNYGLKDFTNAMTFHSLSHKIVQPAEELLFDDKGDFSRKKFSEFVRNTVKKIWNPSFILQLYLFRRGEMKEVNEKDFLTKEDYYLYIKNERYQTLNGEIVKSVGEKYIADFLFDHGINYQYEETHEWGRNYKPDFTIYHEGREIILEHWGIDENDPQKRAPKDWTLSWDEYYQEMQQKREFWKNKGVPLIETSIKDLRNGREHFEGILTNRLREAGINCIKLSEEEIRKRFEEPQQIDKITELFVQFIQKAKKNQISPDNIERVIKENNYPERTSRFLKLASKVYAKYQESLIKSKKIDFDDLIIKAALTIEKTTGNCEIPLDFENDRKVKIKDIKWILIDEYQDFSRLFYHLICSIKKFNKNIRLFCVGDDWQAINGFAGSDLQYFSNYQSFIKDSGIAHLLTNYRSQKAIVESGNNIMAGKGEPCRYVPEKGGGEAQILHIDDKFVERRNNPEYSEQKKKDEKFVFPNDEGFLKAKTLKICYEIIKQHPESSIAILSRTNRIHNVELTEFFNKLKSCFTKEELLKIGRLENKIKCETAHSFKGLEADIVIILNTCRGVFPLIHPNSRLFEIFGETPDKILDEERRLFYVAVTRAKEKLYILTEKDKESDYLTSLSDSLKRRQR